MAGTSSSVYEISSEYLTPALRFEIATGERDYRASFELVYEQYLKYGYEKPHLSGVRFTLFDLVPTSCVVSARLGESIIGTATAVIDVAGVLPSETMYPEEFQRLRDQNLRVMESIHYACISKKFGLSRENERSLVAQGILSGLYRVCLEQKIDLWVIVVHPRHLDYYVSAFGFQRLSEIRSCPRVDGAPGILLGLPLSNPHCSLANLSCGELFSLQAREVFTQEKSTNVKRIEGFSTRLKEHEIYDLLTLRPTKYLESPPQLKKLFQRAYPGVVRQIFEEWHSFSDPLV